MSHSRRRIFLAPRDTFIYVFFARLRRAWHFYRFRLVLVPVTLLPFYVKTRSLLPYPLPMLVCDSGLTSLESALSSQTQRLTSRCPRLLIPLSGPLPPLEERFPYTLQGLVRAALPLAPGSWVAQIPSECNVFDAIARAVAHRGSRSPAVATTA